MTIQSHPNYCTFSKIDYSYISIHQPHSRFYDLDVELDAVKFTSFDALVSCNPFIVIQWATFPKMSNTERCSCLVKTQL